MLAAASAVCAAAAADILPMPPPSPPNGGDVGYYDRPEPLGEHALAWIYVAASSLSILCCVTVLLCHVLAPGLSRFPSSLLLWRVVCDLLLSLHFVLLNSQQLFDTSATDAGVSACTAPLALLAQFGLQIVNITRVPHRGPWRTARWGYPRLRDRHSPSRLVVGQSPGIKKGVRRRPKLPAQFLHALVPGRWRHFRMD